ncbi:MAG TPA: molybdenum cofactor guanylyltransferase [Acidobacteriaceae bacterium]|nr:molybdenum cofactor guanylyltransferase [Acidobacteriaceae bacterium]
MNGFVLSGGLSTRMGRDKARLELGGRALVEIALGQLRELGLEVRICGSHPGLSRSDLSRSDLSDFAPVIADRFTQCGPLGGVEAALHASDAELNLFLPVDLPRIPASFLRWLMERAESSGAVATVPTIEDRPQPLCAVYGRRLRDGLRKSLESGTYKLIAAIENAAAQLGEPVDLFSVETVAATLPAGTWPLEPRPGIWFHNVNTPADYERLRWGESGANGLHPIS